jgi:hypothetical protein
VSGHAQSHGASPGLLPNKLAVRLALDTTMGIHHHWDED